MIRTYNLKLPTWCECLFFHVSRLGVPGIEKDSSRGKRMAYITKKSRRKQRKLHNPQESPPDLILSSSFRCHCFLTFFQQLFWALLLHELLLSRTSHEKREARVHIEITHPTFLSAVAQIAHKDPLQAHPLLVSAPTEHGRMAACFEDA
jgi:hypothetical protein